MRKRPPLRAMRGTLVQVKKVFVRAQNLFALISHENTCNVSFLCLICMLASLHVHMGFRCYNEACIVLALT